MFSLQKPILPFGTSFNSAYVLKTHRFPSSPNYTLALEPKPTSYSKGYQDIFAQEGKAARA
jgi:hypothetical protein